MREDKENLEFRWTEKEKNGQQISKHISNGQRGIDLSKSRKGGRSVKLPSPEGPKVTRVLTREHGGEHPTLLSAALPRTVETSVGHSPSTDCSSPAWLAEDR